MCFRNFWKTRRKRLIFVLHFTKKSTNSTKLIRFEIVDRELKVEKTKAKCDATITTIICLMSSLNSTMLLNLICRKRWNSKTCVITAIEKLSMNVSVLITTFNRWRVQVEKLLQTIYRQQKKSKRLLLVQKKDYYNWSKKNRNRNVK